MKIRSSKTVMSERGFPKQNYTCISYCTAIIKIYLSEITEQQQQLLLSRMAMLMVVELKQVEAIKSDMNSFVSYLWPKGERHKPRWDFQQDDSDHHNDSDDGDWNSEDGHWLPANKLWDLALQQLQKGYAVSPFLLLHNSLLNSQHVLEWGNIEYSVENLEKDTDGDKVPDLIEFQHDTNWKIPDADGDGLTDLFEISYDLTPLKVDGNGNHLTDNLEDPDHDGLTIQQEQQWQTDPLTADADRDHLSDADEVLSYHTDPNKADTDGDTLIDSREIELRLDPLKKDTDDDGRLDSETRVTESVPLPSEFEQKFAQAGTVPEVIVDGQPGAGRLAVIGDASQVDGMMPGIAGLVGHPIDITTTGKFDKATIKFHLTEQAGHVTLDRLRVMWWDEQNKQMVLLPNQRVGAATRTVSAETTHFSRYALINIDAWQRVWDEGYIPGKPTVLRGKINSFAVSTTYAPATWDGTRPKIDVVVDSMGGLVTRYYNEQLSDQPFEINRVVFLATPHLGGQWVDHAKKFKTVQAIGTAFASAAVSLQKADMTLNNMNWRSMEYQSTNGAGYYAIGGVNFGEEWTALPDWLRQEGPTSTMHESWVGVLNDYQAQAKQMIGENIKLEITDGPVELNSAMGTLPSSSSNEDARHVPFDSRWVYIGLYDHAEHTHIHHDSKVMWKTNEILVGGR